MKKKLLLFLFILPTMLISNDIEKQVAISNALATPKGNYLERNRDVPEHEFLIDPVYLGDSYYDYMPGGYNANPLHIQPPISSPYGFSAGGVYLVYHTQETSGSNRRVKFAPTFNSSFLNNTFSIL